MSVVVYIVKTYGFTNVRLIFDLPSKNTSWSSRLVPDACEPVGLLPTFLI